MSILRIDSDIGTFGIDINVINYALESANKDDKLLTVTLTKKQIEESPSLNSDKPVSRQFEETYYGYYGWPMYWDGPYMWGSSPRIVRDSGQWKVINKVETQWDPHLRSTKAVYGNNIQAEDGEIGHVEDFIIDDDTWAIRYLVIDTKNWWPGKKVLISTKWLDHISWTQSKVFVNLTRDTIKKAPEYTDESLMLLDYRKYEAGLHEYYKQEGYWANEPDM
ncbi:PRC-barrel domain protein (fragment) [Desulfamplus magnetovallimortis]|uniref:PRC-barrel domain protein n=1 Tax=Desulfamplus magnetovallimortis TaxID=1246637 RepID=A0A1W1HIU2_9BACT